MNALSTQRHLFDVPDDVAYFNCAYNTPQLNETRSRLADGITNKSHPWTRTPESFFSDAEKVRQLASDIFGGDSDGYAVIPAASYGISTAARAIEPTLQRGNQILLIAEEFPSNVLPWQRTAKETGAEIITVPTPVDGDWTGAILDHMTDGVKIVAVSPCHWTNGSFIDLVPIGEAAREVGAALVLDLTQTLGVTPFSVKDVDPDYMIVGSYKWLLGPYSLGFMYVAPRNQGGKPIEESWITRKGAEDFARLVDYKEEYEAGARRFDMGEKSNFINIPIAIAAMEKLNELGVENIAEYIKSLTDYIAERACAIGLNVADENMRVPNLIGINFKDGVPSHIAGKLAENKIFVSIRGDSIRVAPHIYNEKADVDRLFDVLESEL